MTAPPIKEWHSLESSAQFSDPSDCARRADRFERQVRMRNAIEYAACVLVVLLFGGGAIATLIAGETMIALSLLLVVAGTIIVARNLHRRASNLARIAEDPCLDHLRRQYRRQYDALRSVPVWYIGPLLPGVILLYAVITYKVARVSDAASALAGLAGPAAVTFGLFGVVIVANILAARAIRRKLDELDQAG